jgi:hypothetical protein
MQRTIRKFLIRKSLEQRRDRHAVAQFTFVGVPLRMSPRACSRGSLPRAAQRLEAMRCAMPRHDFNGMMRCRARRANARRATCLARAAKARCNASNDMH